MWDASASSRAKRAARWRPNAAHVVEVTETESARADAMAWKPWYTRFHAEQFAAELHAKRKLRQTSKVRHLPRANRKWRWETSKQRFPIHIGTYPAPSGPDDARLKERVGGVVKRSDDAARQRSGSDGGAGGVSAKRSVDRRHDSRKLSSFDPRDRRVNASKRAAWRQRDAGGRLGIPE